MARVKITDEERKAKDRRKYNRERIALWRAKNPGKARKHRAEWRRDNPDKVQAMERRRYTKIRGNFGYLDRRKGADRAAKHRYLNHVGVLIASVMLLDQTLKAEGKTT